MTGLPTAASGPVHHFGAGRSPSAGSGHCVRRTKIVAAGKLNGGRSALERFEQKLVLCIVDGPRLKVFKKRLAK
jgi:hypothetical protein